LLAEQARIHAANAVAEQMRDQAPAAVAEQVRQQAAAAVAIEVREQSGTLLEDLRRQAATFAPAPGAGVAAGPAPVGSEQMWAALREEIERRTSNFSEAEHRAGELANRLNVMITEGRSSLREAQNDRDAAAFALRESRAELEAAKRALDVSDLSFTLDRLRRAELLLYGTAALAVLAIGLWLWTLLS
jgi:phosphoribosylformylglycinamidine (FGAM) synthase-like enzyme